METTRHEARIHALDRALAPGSETILLGHALEAIRSSPDPDADLAWWVGAYRLYAWAEPRGDDVLDRVLHSGDDLTGWIPPTPTPEDIREWRIAESLTQVQAAQIAGVGARAWQRWEGGERPIPESLRDVLAHRWGSAP